MARRKNCTRIFFRSDDLSVYVQDICIAFNRGVWWSVIWIHRHPNGISLGPRLGNLGLAVRRVGRPAALAPARPEFSIILSYVNYLVYMHTQLYIINLCIYTIVGNREVLKLKLPRSTKFCKSNLTSAPGRKCNLQMQIWHPHPHLNTDADPGSAPQGRCGSGIRHPPLKTNYHRSDIPP